MYLPHTTPINVQYILYTKKHHKLRHSKSGREKFGSGHRQNYRKKKKPRVKHEPRSAHGRAVKKKRWVKHEPRRPMAARLKNRGFGRNRPLLVYQYNHIIAPRLSGRDKLLYLVVFSLYASLVWELRDKRKLK